MELAVKLRFPPANRHFAPRELDFETPQRARRRRRFAGRIAQGLRQTRMAVNA